jgi:hypothetical protein
MPRAFLQTTFTSRMAQEACSDSTETTWTYHEHRRLLDDEMMAVCRIYAEVEWTDLPAHEGERARKWLMSTCKDIERAREHVAMRIREAGEWGAPLLSLRGGTRTAKRAEGGLSERHFKPKQRQPVFSHKRPKPMGYRGGRGRWQGWALRPRR